MAMLFYTQIVFGQPPKIHARSAILMDASNGRVLLEENGYERMPNASTTKIMTCILAVEFMQKNRVHCNTIPVVVSKKAASMPKVHLGMKEGEQYHFEDLLYSLMLESHNDTAVAIAEYIAGSTDAFADLMNEKTNQLGCMNTFFVTPNGLDKQKDGRWHESCAYDLGVMACYAMKNEQFRGIVNTREYKFSNLAKTRAFSICNKNVFLDSMAGANGIKTGFTAKAGYCFVGALEREGKCLISVVLASGWPPNKSWKWEDTKSLMEYGLTEYSLRSMDKILDYEKIEIPIRDGVKKEMSVYLEGDPKQKREELTVLLSKKDRVNVYRRIKKELVAPVKRGQIVGYEIYELNGKPYQAYPIKCAESVNLRTYFYCMREIFMLYFKRM